MGQLKSGVIADIESLCGLHKEIKWVCYGVALMLKHQLRMLGTTIPAEDFVQDMKDLILWLDKNADNPFKENLQQ